MSQPAAGTCRAFAPRNHPGRPGSQRLASSPPSALSPGHQPAHRTRFARLPEGHGFLLVAAGVGPAERVAEGRRIAAAEEAETPSGPHPGAETLVAGGLSGGDASTFVPVRVLEGNAPADVEIHMGDGRMICVRPGFDRQTFRDVVAALSAAPSRGLEGGPC